jgi:hypothetical protein
MGVPRTRVGHGPAIAPEARFQLYDDGNGLPAPTQSAEDPHYRDINEAFLIYNPNSFDILVASFGAGLTSTGTAGVGSDKRAEGSAPTGVV